jgi:hypothetical protein
VMRATASRSCRWCGAEPLAEAAGFAHVLDGRNRRERQSPPLACAVDSGLASPPKRYANRSGLRDDLLAVGRAPKGPERLPQPKSWLASTGHRGGAMVHRPPRWRDEYGEPVLGIGDAPIHRSGPPRHQTGLEPPGEPVDSTSNRAPRRHPKVSARRASETSLQSWRSLNEPR